MYFDDDTDFEAIEANAPRVVVDSSAIAKAHEAELQRLLAPSRAQVLRAQGDRFLRTSAGVALIVAAGSLWNPDPPATERVIEKIVYQDRPVVAAQPVMAPSPSPVGYAPAAALVDAAQPAVAPAPVVAAPAPVAPRNTPEHAMPDGEIRVGASHTPASFKDTTMFRTARGCAGRLVSHVKGVLRFDDGSECFDATLGGQVDARTTSTRHDGDLAVCNGTGKVFPNGVRQVACYALHNGVAEDIRASTTADKAALNDPVTQR